MSNELLTQQQQAAASLLANGSMEKQAIAKYIGISRTTLYQWMKNDNFNAEVDRLKHEIKVFGQEIIAGKLAEAVSKYWNLIESTDNQRVKAEGYQYFINRNLGKPTSKLELEAGMKEAEVSDDILDAEFEEWDQEN